MEKPKVKTVKTRIVKASEPGAALAAAEAAVSGGVIIYPTETLYGIGGLALNPKVAARVSLIKNRPENKPLPVLVKDMEMLAKYFLITEKQARAYAKILPLPLTLVLEEREKEMFPKEVSDGGFTAVRISAGDFTRRIFKRLSEPLISSSANISGEKNLSDGQSVARIFGGRVELIADCGRLPPSEGSAVVSLAGRSPKVLRNGDIKSERLKEFLKWLS